MIKFKPYRNEELYLLPPAIEDFVSEKHLARVVNEVVESLDTKDIEAKYSELGQHSYHPKISLKLIIYGYSTGTRSGRKIAAKCETDTAYMYLAHGYRPNFRTINDFRKDNMDKINEYFVDVVRLCQKLGLVKVGLISIDGSKFRANASSKRTKDRKGYQRWLKNIEKQIEEILKEAEETDKQEDIKYGKDKRGDELPEGVIKKEDLKEKVKKAMEELRDEEEKLNLTDPDAKFMKERNGVTRTNYNAQVATTKDQIIVAADVTKVASDNPSLIPMLEQAEENIGEEVGKVLADAGAASLGNYEQLEEKKKDAYLPDRNLIMRKEGKFKDEKKKFHKGNFEYDKKENCYTCPEGKKLILRREKEVVENGKKKKLLYYEGVDCKDCLFRPQCVKSRRYRIICRDERERLIDKMREKLKTKAGWKTYLIRMYTVEPIFGNIKRNFGYRDFLLRSLDLVTGEFRLMCIAHNIKKIHQSRADLALVA